MGPEISNKTISLLHEAADARPAHTALKRHLDNLLSAVKPPSRNEPVVGKLLRSAAELYARADYTAATEIYCLATEIDNLSETAFLGAGLASLALNRMTPARAYIAQARTLHDLIGGHTQLQLYDSLIAMIDGAPITSKEAGVRTDIAADERDLEWYRRYARRNPTRAGLRDIVDFDRYFLPRTTDTNHQKGRQNRNHRELLRRTHGARSAAAEQ